MRYSLMLLYLLRCAIAMYSTLSFRIFYDAPRLAERSTEFVPDNGTTLDKIAILLVQLREASKHH